jgi:hypothetical protein
LGGRFINASGAWRSEVMNVRLDVIASEAKQSILSCCSNGLLRFARNDGRGSGLLRGACHRVRLRASRNDEWGNRFSDNGDVTTGPQPVD